MSENLDIQICHDTSILISDEAFILQLEFEMAP